MNHEMVPMFQNHYIAGICGAIKSEKEFNLLIKLYSDEQYRAMDIEKILGNGNSSRVLASFYDVTMIVPLFFPTGKLMKYDDKRHRPIKAPMVTHLGKSVVEGIYNFIEIGGDFAQICDGLYENRIILREPPVLKAKKKAILQELTLEYFKLRAKYVSEEYSFDLSMDESHDQKLAVNDELIGLGQDSDYQNLYHAPSVDPTLITNKLEDPEIQIKIAKLLSAISRKNPLPLQLISEHNLENKLAKRNDIFELAGYKDNPGDLYKSLQGIFKTGFCALLNIDGEEYFDITPLGYDFMGMLQDIEKLHNSPWYRSVDEAMKNMPPEISSDVSERSELITTYLKLELGETLSRMNQEKMDEDNNIYFLDSFNFLIRDITLNDIEIVKQLESTEKKAYSATMDITLKCRDQKNKCTESDLCKGAFKSNLSKAHNNAEVLDIHSVQDSANPLRCKLKVKFVPGVQSFITKMK